METHNGFSVVFQTGLEPPFLHFGVIWTMAPTWTVHTGDILPVTAVLESQRTRAAVVGNKSKVSAYGGKSHRNYPCS